MNMAKNNKNDTGLHNLKYQLEKEKERSEKIQAQKEQPEPEKTPEPTEETEKAADKETTDTPDKTAEATNEKPEKEKGKPGRKPTKDVKNTCKNINVAIPKELIDKWNEIKKAKGNNLTQYVTDLIQKDMDENYDKYKQAVDILNNL